MNTIKTAAAAVALTIAAMAPANAAYEFTYKGKTTMVCTWTEAGATMYRDAKTGNVSADARIVKLPAEHEANQVCKDRRAAAKAERAAKKAAKAKGKGDGI